MRAGGGSVGDLLCQVALGYVGEQQSVDVALQQRSALLGDERSVGRLRGACDAGVDPVELRVFALADAQAGGVRGQTSCEQRVFEDLDVTLDGGTGHTGVASETGDVDRLSMAEGGDGQKAGEAGEVPHERLALDF